MVMADYSEFNNNNYLPGVYNEMDAALNYHSALAHTRSPGVAQNGFTFTSPTQCITLATYRPSIQTTSPISSLSAPGIGTSWQHSIPVTMPWVDMKSPVCHPGVGTTTVFTGTRTSPSFSSEGQFSTNVPVRCPKRKALDVLDEAPTSKIYLCADQFANLKISAGEKQNFGLPADDGGNTGVQFYTGVKTSKSKCDIEGWQRFRDIENRLDVEVEEDIDLNMGKVRGSKEGPCLKVAEGVLGPAVVNSQILPRRVMEDITKPCMQVVLWKSPGEIIREIAQEEVTKTPSSFSTTITTNVTSINRTTATNRMDTSERYPLSSRDNIMDTTLGAPTLDPISHFQPAPSSSFSSANFLTPPLLPNMVQIPASTHGNISHAAANSTNNGLVDLDMFDSLDDDMQL